MSLALSPTPTPLVTNTELTDSKNPPPENTSNYTIQKGDTLKSIAKKLLGDIKYWSQLWAVNHSILKNPDDLVVGHSINVTVASQPRPQSRSLANVPSPIKPPALEKKSMEWKQLPHQRWESQSMTSQQADALGFDKNSKIYFHQLNKTFPITLLPSRKPIPFLGQITAATTINTELVILDEVYIREDRPLEIGKTYWITKEPSLLKSSASDHVGLTYPILGMVKILGHHKKLSLGSIIANQAPIARGSSLIPMIPIPSQLTPIPAPNALEGHVILQALTNLFDIMAAVKPMINTQFSEVFIDRGQNDGVRPGMIFRIYEHYDLSNDKKITAEPLLTKADLMVIYAAETFCTSIVLRTTTELQDTESATLLTDISTIMKNSQTFTEPTAIDPLENLDHPSPPKINSPELKDLEDSKPTTSEDTPMPITLPTPGPSSIPDTPPPPIDLAPDSPAPPVNP